MKKNKNCDVVKDLLPSYIDNLTSEESNEFIQNHLVECRECNTILNNMQKAESINANYEENSKKYINWAKKFNKKYNILKIILIVIFMIIIISILRKVVILTLLMNKADNSLNIDNYHSRTYSSQLDFIMITEIYNKDKKSLSTLTTISKKTNRVFDIKTEYYDGEKCNVYSEYYGEDARKVPEKTATLNNKEPFIVNTRLEQYSPIKGNSPLVIFLNSITGKIKRMNCNGKDTYRLTDLVIQEERETFIDKNTGLPVRSSGKASYNSKNDIYNMYTDYFIEFNTVTDEDLLEPNINEYLVNQNS